MEVVPFPARRKRKVLKSGASKVVALPPDWLRALNLGVGDTVELLYDSVVIVKPKGVKLDPALLSKELEALANLETKGQVKEASE